MPRHETALEWYQRCRRPRQQVPLQQQQQQQLHQHHQYPPQQQHPQHHPQLSFTHLLHDLLFLKSHNPTNHSDPHGTTTTTAYSVSYSTTTSMPRSDAPYHSSLSSPSIVVLEGCLVAKSWIMIHMIQEWVKTTPHSVLVMNGESRIQLGLLPLLLGKTGPSSSSSSIPNTSTIPAMTNNDQATKESTRLSSSSAAAPAAQDYMQRIHFGMGSVALLELVRYSCAAATTTTTTNHHATPTTSVPSSATPAPLLLVWDDYPDDPDMTRQLGRMIQSFPQLLVVVVAGKWSGGMAQRIQVERKAGGCWMGTVAGKRFDFRITIDGIC